MKLTDYRKLIKDAGERNAKLPVFLSVILIEAETLQYEAPEDICSALGMSEHYAHLVRSIFKVPSELRALGANIVKEKYESRRIQQDL